MMALGSAGIWTTVIVVARPDGPEEAPRSPCPNGTLIARVDSSRRLMWSLATNSKGRVQSRPNSDGPVHYDEARRQAVQFLSSKAA